MRTAFSEAPGRVSITSVSSSLRDKRSRLHAIQYCIIWPSSRSTRCFSWPWRYSCPKSRGEPLRKPHNPWCFCLTSFRGSLSRSLRSISSVTIMEHQFSIIFLRPWQAWLLLHSGILDRHPDLFQYLERHRLWVGDLSFSHHGHRHRNLWIGADRRR